MNEVWRRCAVLPLFGVNLSFSSITPVNRIDSFPLGFTTSEDLSELSGLYKSYAEIGGNGKIETLFNRFKDLPIKK